MQPQGEPLVQHMAGAEVDGVGAGDALAARAAARIEAGIGFGHGFVLFSLGALEAQAEFVQ
jgi:hypothetical protein